MTSETQQRLNAIYAEIAAKQQVRNSVVSNQVFASILAIVLSIVASFISALLDFGFEGLATINWEKDVDWTVAIFLLLANAFYGVQAGFKRLKLTREIKKLQKEAATLSDSASPMNINRHC